MKRNPLWLLGTLVAMSASATPHVEWLGAVTGTARERVGDVSEAELILLFSGEQLGRLGDCGCPSRPLGGLSRIAGYAQTVRRQTDAPVLLVNMGRAFDDTIDISGGLRADVQAINALMSDALESWDVVNLAASDIPWLDEHALGSLVSANVLPTDGRPHSRAHVVEVGEHRVAIIPLSGPGLAFLPPEHYQTGDALDALDAVLAEVQADTIVVVALDLNSRIMELAGHDRVDVLVTAGSIHESWAPEVLGQTVWMRSITDGQVLTDVRLSWSDALDRVVVHSVDLDDRLPEERATRRLEQQAARIRTRALP